MALSIQNINMTGSFVPYERPPQPATLWSAIPRGLQTFHTTSGVIIAKAINDTFIMNLNATLPPNFGYVMAFANMTVAQDEAGGWDPFNNLNLQNFYRAPTNLSLALSGNWPQEFPIVAVDDSQRCMMQVAPYPSFPIIGTHGTSGVLIVYSASNPSAPAALAGVVNAFIAFWQFDLEQIRKFPINSPIPVQAR